MHRIVSYSVYILSNRHHTVFYVGVTSDLKGRVFQHKQEGGAFTLKYNCNCLMYFEDFADVRNAIAREKQLKKWRKDWKFDLIKKDNPKMRDLAADWYPTIPKN